MLGRRSAPWCVPPHPIYIWMSEGVGGEGEAEERMEGRKDGGKGCVRGVWEEPSLSFPLPLPRRGRRKKIWMKGDVVVVAAVVGGGGVDSRASVCPFAHHIKCMGSPWQRRK